MTMEARWAYLMTASGFVRQVDDADQRDDWAAHPLDALDASGGRLLGDEPRAEPDQAGDVGGLRAAK